MASPNGLPKNHVVQNNLARLVFYSSYKDLADLEWIQLRFLDPVRIHNMELVVQIDIDFLAFDKLELFYLKTVWITYKW